MSGTLGDYVDIILGGTPKTSVQEYWGGDILWVTPGDIGHSKHIITTAKKITQAGVQNSNTKLLSEYDVIISARGSVGKIVECDQPMAFNQSCYAIRTLNNKKLNEKFLYYLTHSCIRYLKQNSAGSVFNAIVMSTLARTPVNLPSIKEQERIAFILSAYDDLIENNRRRIELLEESAGLLYKEWFVNLRFPSHEHVKNIDGVPEGWEKKCIGEMAPFKYGKSLKKDMRVPGPFPVYGSSGIIGSHEKALIKGPTIIIGRKGNVGSVYWSSSDCYPIDTVYFIDSDNSNIFLYYALFHTSFISTDVAVPGLNRKFAHSIKILVPDLTLLGLFEDHTKNIHRQIDQLTEYNQILSQARDLLLPRLMNGEVTI